MRKIWYLVVILALIWTSSSAESVQDLDTKVAELFRQNSTVGGSLVIAKDGEIVYSYDYGYSNATHKTPVTDQTYYRIASVTKMISAIGVMQLVEQGKIDLDVDISTYFGYAIANPYHPETPITLRQCLSHTSTISENGGYTNGTNRTIKEMLSKENRSKPNFISAVPGTTYKYSNFGAGIMGAVMESVTSKSVNRIMEESVFAPLGIDAAYHPDLLDHPETASAQHVKGRVKKGPTYYSRTPYEDFADPESHYKTTVGNIFITSRDMAKIAILLCGDGTYQGTRILKKKTVELMRTEQHTLPNSSVVGKSPYGLCVVKEEGTALDGLTLYGHQGLTGDTLCNVYFDPETGYVCVVLTNGCKPERKNRVSILARSLLRLTYPIFTD